MSSKDQNLSTSVQLKDFDFSAKKVGIVVSRWNEDITYALRDACKETLELSGINSSNIFIIEVPGSFEIPMGAKMLLQSKAYDAVIGLGCVIKGETTHNEYINQSVANGLMQLSIVSNKPCIFGVLTPNNKQQAIDRAGGKYGNKGVEAANTALQMIMLKAVVSEPKNSIGFGS